MKKIIYLHEAILNRELILFNNSKKLKHNPNLLNETHLERIEEISKEIIKLQEQPKTQKQIRKLRDELRELSMITYTQRSPEIFGQMVLDIVNNLAKRPNFSNYTYIDEMKSLAISYIFKYTHKFDPTRQSSISNQYVSAFAYITTIAVNAFVFTINKFNKEQEKAKENFLEHQKLFHRDPNSSSIIPEYEVTHRTIQLPNLENKENSLHKIIKSTTINEPTEFWIPKEYKISEKELSFILKYEFNISIRRL